MDVESAVERLEGQLRAVATPERAASEKRYLKSDLAFLGATLWQIRAAVKEIVREHRYLDHENLVNLVEALWAEPVHERRMALVILLRPPRESPQRRWPAVHRAARARVADLGVGGRARRRRARKRRRPRKRHARDGPIGHR